MERGGNMKKNVISLFVSTLLAVTIYVLITFEVHIFHLLISQLHSLCHLLIAIIINMTTQITIISLLSTIAIKKFGLTIKFAWISTIILFLLFNVYTFPSFYLLLFAKRKDNLNNFVLAIWYDLISNDRNYPKSISNMD